MFALCFPSHVHTPSLIWNPEIVVFILKNILFLQVSFSGEPCDIPMNPGWFIFSGSFYLAYCYIYICIYIHIIPIYISYFGDFIYIYNWLVEFDFHSPQKNIRKAPHNFHLNWSNSTGVNLKSSQPSPPGPAACSVHRGNFGCKPQRGPGSGWINGERITWG